MTPNPFPQVWPNGSYRYGSSTICPEASDSKTTRVIESQPPGAYCATYPVVYDHHGPPPLFLFWFIPDKLFSCGLAAYREHGIGHIERDFRNLRTVRREKSHVLDHHIMVFPGPADRGPHLFGGKLVRVRLSHRSR